MAGQIRFTGYFGVGPVPAPAPGLAPKSAPGPVPVPVPEPVHGPPVFTALAKAFTVKDVWREWKEGIAGQPAIQELEETWESRWRPGNIVRVQFCRRKIIWDELRAHIAPGKTEEEAIAELELLRTNGSLNRLVDTLHRRRKI
ncbi:hypothetical protein BP5796_01811 [Coleophoma crateriformis]|uniref:Transcription activator GCR1-like domain-containing protein n=1 Tax=Coleophoma crateriformis TaxID=565419 RepID=A0A3D8T1G1_9HELO|nr:hypothetical protein BP5796_01811 [Coleophoma crateriformis]